jgi:hypothetical protein
MDRYSALRVVPELKFFAHFARLSALALEMFEFPKALNRRIRKEKSAEYAEKFETYESTHSTPSESRRTLRPSSAVSALKAF